MEIDTEVVLDFNVNDIVQIDNESNKKAIKLSKMAFSCNCFSPNTKVFFKTTVNDEGVCDHCGYYAVKREASGLEEFREEYRPQKRYKKKTPEQKQEEAIERRKKWDRIMLRDYNTFGPFLTKLAAYHKISYTAILKRLESCSNHISSLFSKENQMRYILVHGYTKFGPDRRKIERHFNITERTLLRYLNHYGLNDYYNLSYCKKFNADDLRKIKAILYH